MFLKLFLSVSRQTQRNIFRTNSLRSLSSNNSTKQNSTIREGVLFSDASDIEIPSANLTETIFEKIERFQKFKAIVSIRTTILNLQIYNKYL